MDNKPAHFMTNSEPAKTGLLEFDLLAIQAFLKIERIKFDEHCECLGKGDAERIIRGLI